MHILLHFLFFVVPFIIVIDGQGARGGSRGGGGSRGSSSRGSSCRGPDCRKAGIIAGSVIGGIFFLAAIVFFIIFCYCRYRRSRVSESNASFISKNSPDGNNRSYKTYEEDYFKNGNWQGRYHQYGRWHGPHEMLLTFDRASNRVTGYGSDDVGKFNIDGTISVENQRIVVTKTYEIGTGDIKENFGHTVTMHLAWDSNHAQFEGKWFVQTNHYHDEDKFELKFANVPLTSLEKRIN